MQRYLTLMMTTAFFCAGASAVMSAEPIWTREVNLIDSPPGRLAILGVKEDDKFIPWSVVLPERPTAPVTVSFPLRKNLAPDLTFRSFGAEERVKIARTGEGLTLHCTAGQKPAGAILSLSGFHFPRRVAGTIVVDGRATGAFRIAVAEVGKDATTFTALSSGQSTIPSSTWAQLGLAEELVIPCPDGPAELTLSRIEIEPTMRPVAQPAGTWIWDIRPWLGQEDRLLSELKRSGIGEVFIQTVIVNGAISDRAAVAKLMRELSAHGIRVNTVEGDPRMASPEGRAVAVERARLLAGLKDEIGGKLLSFQYDIEPYTLPEFEADPVLWWKGWGTTISELAAAVKEPISVVVPWWLLRHPAAEAALDQARGSVARIVVMSYRTAPGDVEEIAEAWLDWSDRHGVPVAFALETGFVPTEFQHHYVRAERGTVLLEVAGRTGRLLLFDQPVLGTGNSLAYSFDNESKIETERITFWNDREKLTKVRDRLQANLSAWKAFDGLLVHEILKP